MKVSTLAATLGRETKGEVVLVERLRAALYTFNPTLPPEAISNAIDELARNHSLGHEPGGRQPRSVYRLFKESIAVSVPVRARHRAVSQAHE